MPRNPRRGVYVTVPFPLFTTVPPYWLVSPVEIKTLEGSIGAPAGSTSFAITLMSMDELFRGAETTSSLATGAMLGSGSSLLMVTTALDGVPRMAPTGLPNSP